MGGPGARREAFARLRRSARAPRLTLVNRHACSTRTGTVQATAMDDGWLTYEEVAVRLGVTPRAARARAFRGRWSKMQGNDGRARVRLPDERPVPARNTTVHPTGHALVHALESHIKTLQGENEALKEQLRAEADRLAASEARSETQAADLVADLVAERARTEKAIEAFASLAERLDALAAERARPWWRRLARG